MIRAGDDDTAAGGRVIAAIVLAGWKNPREERGHEDRASEQETRYRDLLQKNFVSPDAYAQVKTNVETANATVHADEATIESAKLQLEYCTIRSPVNGYAGRIQIQQGNLVRASDANPLVVLNQVVPVYASFAVPEQSLADIRLHQAKGDLRVEAHVASTSAKSSIGRLSFIDNSADLTTGTIKLRAEFPNTDKALWPGQFVNVVMTLFDQKDAIVAPSSAIQSGPNGQYVFVVKADMTAELRTIQVSRTEGDDAVVASGLTPGDKVVTGGQVRLAPGTKVSLGAEKTS